MSPRLSRSWPLAAVACLLLVGCGDHAGYTQSPEELTPRVDILAGDNQSAPVNSAFPTQIRVRFHKNGMSLGGHLILFTAPTTGASGTFSGLYPQEASVVTDGHGEALAPVFTANGTTGTYTILVWNGNYQNTVHLTNLAAVPLAEQPAPPPTGPTPGTKPE
ncbi:MAG: repeat protein [Holophagaceae bacterium]|nr:repeat protein [Holophagaceae bacterium]